MENWKTKKKEVSLFGGKLTSCFYLIDFDFWLWSTDCFSYNFTKWKYIHLKCCLTKTFRLLLVKANKSLIFRFKIVYFMQSRLHNFLYQVQKLICLVIGLEFSLDNEAKLKGSLLDNNFFSISSTSKISMFGQD